MTDSFVHTQNIQRFEQMLRNESDPQKRAVIERLLEEERNGMSGAGAIHPNDPDVNSSDTSPPKEGRGPSSPAPRPAD